MNRQAPPVSRPQKQGTAVSPGTRRTLKSALGMAISFHGEDSGIIILFIVRVVVVALHLLEPDLIHDDIDGRRVVPIWKTDAEGGNRPFHGLTPRFEAVN